MPTIPVHRLQPGMYIILKSLGWMDHPFLLNHFRITGEDQIQTLRKLGLTEVEWDPQRSATSPLDDAPAPPPPREDDHSGAALKAMLEEKRNRVLRVREKREGMARCARLFDQETASIRQILGDTAARPNEAFTRGRELVNRLVGGLTNAGSVAVHLVNLKKAETGLPSHAMNVLVLSLLIGKHLGLDAEEMKQLGLGAMLHDVGLNDIPARVVRNANRSSAEEQFYRTHIGRGLNAIATMRQLPLPVKNIIACHHETWDGKGYPNGMAGAKIPRLARIVTIANRYDNLCNPLDAGKACLPAEAVARMFKDEAGAFDPDILNVFVKAIGIYPPGTFVALQDGSYGLVIESNSRNLLRPVLMLYDSSVPRNEALLLNLAETDEKIAETLLPAKLPREVIEYLAPQGRVDFYIEGQA